MEGLLTASRARQWATLGMSANNAQYTLLCLLKKGKLNPIARKYAEEGKELFGLLDEAVKTRNSGRITEARQLAAVAAMPAIAQRGTETAVEATDITKVLKLFQEIVAGNEQDCTKEQITEGLEVVQRLSDAYAEAGFKDLQTLRNAYDRPIAGC